MFDTKDYICVCHGCGTFHIIRASFLSAPMMIRVGDWCLPALGCRNCQYCPRDAQGDGPIGRAWKHGMTPEAFAEAQRQFNTEWRATLEAKHKGAHR